MGKLPSKDIQAFEAIPLGDLLVKHFFRVPPYQRPYSWEKEQLEEFWDDLLSAIEDPSSSHFIGPMFFIGDRQINRSERKILDGQQRLITSTIILRLLHDFLGELYDNSNVNRRRDIFGKIKGYIIANSSNRKKIEGSRRNLHIYEFLMRDYSPFGKVKQLMGQVKGDKTNKKIVDCYKFFLKKLIGETGLNVKNVKKDEDIRLSGESLEVFLDRVESICSALSDKFYLLEISLENEELASEIFETLNQRGGKLMFTDLFKNMLFERFKDVLSEDEIAEFWEALLSEADNDEDNVRDYLRYYWLSSKDFIREKKMFREYKNLVRSIPQTKSSFRSEIYDILLREAKIFFSLRNSSSNLWPSQDLILKQLIDEMTYLGFKQQMPLLLSIYISSEGNRKVLRRSYEALNNFLVKRQLFLERNPNEYEEKYSEWAISIRNSERKISDVLNEIMMDTPSQEEILRKVEEGLTLKKAKYAKYILVKVNDSLNESSVMDIWTKDPTLEHIYPQTSDDEWKEIIKKDGLREIDILNRLGNLTILDLKKNSELGNINYTEKKEKYLDSKIPLNMETIDADDDFSIKFLRGREEKISKIIKNNKIWENT